MTIIKIEEQSLKDLDNNEIVKDLEEQSRLRIKQYIILGMIIKLVTLIKVILVLVDSLSAGYYKSTIL